MECLKMGRREWCRQHFPTSVIKPQMRKRSTTMWKQHQLIKILQWKYRRKSTQGNNLIIASRLYYSLSKKESKWKEAENEENSRRSMLTVRIAFETHLNGHCSPLKKMGKVSVSCSTLVRPLVDRANVHAKIH